jgi:hypothetical protein
MMVVTTASPKCASDRGSRPRRLLQDSLHQSGRDPPALPTTGIDLVESGRSRLRNDNALLNRAGLLGEFRMTA